MTDLVSFRQFQALDLRVGTVSQVRRHSDADRLYVVQINLGEMGTRQSVTSLVPHYTEEDLKGRSVIALVNLEPARMRGEVSECMLLCAETEDESLSILVTPSASAPAGTRVV